MGSAASSLDSTVLSSIRLINADDFLALGTFPRYPENKEIALPLDQLSSNLHKESVIVFISHCWLRGCSEAAGWDGRPHPDNAEGSKFALCVEGIKFIRQYMAPGMKKCYLWLDYGCIDQDGNPAGELKLLDKIVQMCDCVFTPVFDPDPSSWELPFNITNMYTEYKSVGWIGQPYSYLSRGWCRVEMFYAANIPLLEKDEERLSKFSQGLAFHAKDGRRPHIVFGSYDLQLRQNPFIMPPLQNSWFEEYHPTKGHLTQSSDQEVIDQLVEDLKPFMKEVKTGYIGEYDENGQEHGKGVYRYQSGDVYEGEFRNGFREGFGVYTYSDGDRYEGGYLQDKKHGKGKFTYGSGAYYEGDWVNGNKEGNGVYQDIDGDRYEGGYHNDLRHGKGKFVYRSGACYEGDWVAGRKEGKGVYTDQIGSRYEGDWMNDMFHGQGKMSYANGNVYEGMFVKDVREGQGVFIYVNGNKYMGEWLNDKFHGHGKMLFTSGSVHDGLYVNGVKEGYGVYVDADGDRYEGEFHGGNRQGKGKFIYSDGTVSEGIFEKGDLVSS